MTAIKAGANANETQAQIARRFSSSAERGALPDCSQRTDQVVSYQLTCPRAHINNSGDCRVPRELANWTCEKGFACSISLPGCRNLENGT